MIPQPFFYFVEAVRHFKEEQEVREPLEQKAELPYDFV